MTDNSGSASSLTGVSEYWREATRPLVSLVFVAPMLLAYEGGLLFWPKAMRNGADVWLRHWLELLGFTQYFLLPVLICGTLLGWHHLKNEQWHVRWPVLYGMVLESMAFGFLLLIFAQVQGSIFNRLDVTVPCAAYSTGSAARVLAFFGAGIYEELLFRLLMLPLLVVGLQAMSLPRRTSIVVAVVISSMLFAAAHYQLDLMIGQWHIETAYGDTFQWPSFLFRFSAGAFFSALFLCRGFGIAVGAHALYDILVATM